MAGFIELIAKIKPKNNGKYPLVDDVDVEMEDGSRLSEAIKKPRIPDGGTKGQVLAKKSDKNGDGEWVDGLKMEDVDKKLEGKLDKNLGSENPDKVLITDSQGNIVLQDKEDFEGGGVTDYNGLNNRPSINGITLTGNKTSADLDMYTKEEVDEMLYEKMDKPYAPITITNDTTIEDCLDGYFKIDKIKGNTYQAQETDIVPTPSRPVPINSRKTTITKMNLNIFDLEKESNTSNIPDTGTYRSIGQHQLKPNTKYVFSWSGATVPAKSTLSLQIQDDKGTVLVSPFTYFNLQADEKKEAGKQVEFTTNESGIIKFAYNCVVATSSTTETYQQYWYTKILKDISLKEDVEYEPEYVELRSLKETSNLFDKNIMAFTSGTLNSDGTVGTNASYAVSGFVPVGPSTQYTIKVIDGFRDSTKVYYDINKQVISNEAIATFTTPSNCYFVRWQTATTDTRVLTEEDIQKINDEMMMVKGDSLPSSYVAPTVRDYKIVDHTTKTSKIVRNVNQFELPTDFSWNDTNYYPTIIGNVIPEDKKGAYDTRHYNLTNYTTEQYFSYSNISGMYLVFSECDTYWEFNNSDEVNAFLTRIKEDGKPFLFQYQLATPVEEPIAYVETDVNEVGYSWQDTTSPSPTIKSEVKGVEEIDILKTGKNLFDVDKVIDGERLKNNGDGSLTVITTADDSSASNNIQKLSDIANLTVGETYTLSAKTTGTQKQIWLEKSKSIWVFGKSKTITQDDLDSIVYFYASGTNTQAIVSDIQLEVGDTATAYEPYQSQQILITPPQPLYENDIANVESGDYEYSSKNTTIDFNRFEGNVDMIQEYTIRYYFNKSLAQELNGIVLDTLMFDCFRKVNDNSDTVHFKIGGMNNEYIFIYIPKNCTNDKKYAKEYLSSLNLIANFVVETKTTQPIPPEDLTKIKSLTTDKGINNIFINGEIKPTIEARYALDIASIVSKLQTKLLTLQEEVVKNV